MNKRIFELTVEEFLVILNQHFPQSTNAVQAEPTTEKRYIYSIKGLAEFLNCSVPTAQKIKNSGKIPFMQTGRKCVFDGTAVLNSLSNQKKGTRS